MTASLELSVARIEGKLDTIVEKFSASDRELAQLVEFLRGEIVRLSQTAAENKLAIAEDAKSILTRVDEVRLESSKAATSVRTDLTTKHEQIDQRVISLERWRERIRGGYLVLAGLIGVSGSILGALLSRHFGS